MSPEPGASVPGTAVIMAWVTCSWGLVPPARTQQLATRSTPPGAFPKPQFQGLGNGLTGDPGRYFQWNGFDTLAKACFLPLDSITLTTGIPLS